MRLGFYLLMAQEVLHGKVNVPQVGFYNPLCTLHYTRVTHSVSHDSVSPELPVKGESYFRFMKGY